MMSRNSANFLFNAVRDALQHYHDVHWLGQHTLLATPYFLGKSSQRVIHADSAERGEQLQSLLYQAATTIWGGTLPTTRNELIQQVELARHEKGNKSPRYLYFLLELRYLRHYFPLRTAPNKVDAMPAYVNVSRSRFFVHLEAAITLLMETLLAQVQPSLQLERPFSTKQLIARDELLAEAAAHLNNGISVTLSGMGGVGKTAAGIHIQQHWQSDAIFWYTFRPGLNDDLYSVLFALAHFFRQLGHAELWRYLLAHQEQALDHHHAIGFLRADIQASRVVKPLHCFDEVDILQTSDQSPRRVQHVLILELLESLVEMTPTLLIGQRSYLDTPQHFVVLPFTSEQTGHFLAQTHIVLPNAHVNKLQEQTQGNPRLLELYTMLHEDGFRVQDIYQSLSLKPLFHRLWKRLDSAERALLGQVSVFRSTIPLIKWDTQQAAQNSLHKRRLIQYNQDGTASLLPAYRELIYSEIPAQTRHIYHRNAAQLRAEVGEYTSAAYHHCAADAPAVAIDLWYQHREAEIRQGKLIAAAGIFESLVPNTLPDVVRDKLLYIRNRSHLYQGNIKQVVADMATFSRQHDTLLAAELTFQAGQAHGLSGDIATAQDNFATAVQTLGQVTERTVTFLVNGGKFYTDEGDLALARQHMLLAQFKVTLFNGQIELFASNYHAARAILLEALAIAEQLDKMELMAQAQDILMRVCGHLGELDSAEKYATAAIETYQALGHTRQIASVRSSLGSMYLNIRQFDKAVALLEPTLDFFETHQQTLHLAPLYSNLAEAYYETGKPQLAQKLINQCLQLEQAHVIPYALYTLSLIHQDAARLDDAIIVLQRGIKQAQQNGDRFIEAYLHREQGKLQRTMRQPDQADSSIHTALQLFETMGIQHEIQATQQLLESSTT